MFPTNILELRVCVRLINCLKNEFYFCKSLKKYTSSLNALFSFSQVTQATWTFTPVEHASLQPVLTTLSRCGTLDPIRCYNTIKVKYITNSIEDVFNLQWSHKTYFCRNIYNMFCFQAFRSANAVGCCLTLVLNFSYSAVYGGSLPQ